MDPFGPTPLVFTLVPLLIAAAILFAIVKGVSEWSTNNAQPILTVRACLVAKRTDVSTDHSSIHDNHHHFHDHTTTRYYVTFELPSGERREVRVGGSEYGLLAEGDSGDLTLQGTRYHGFVRTS